LDIIQHGSTGLLAYPSNHTVEDFTNHIQHLIANPVVRQNISLQSRQWAEQWNWKAATVKLRTNQYHAAISLHHMKQSATSSSPLSSPLLTQLFSTSQNDQRTREQELRILKHYSV
jgi:hypothetical protein